MRTVTEKEWKCQYTTGVRDGEKRLARALRRWAEKKDKFAWPITTGAIRDFLSARLKEKK